MSGRNSKIFVTIWFSSWFLNFEKIRIVQIPLATGIRSLKNVISEFLQKNMVPRPWSAEISGLKIYLPDIVIGIRWVFYEDFDHPCPVSPAIARRVYHFWSCRGSRRNRGRPQQPRHYFVLSPGTLAPRDQHRLYVCAHWKFAPFCHLHFSKNTRENHSKVDGPWKVNGPARVFRFRLFGGLLWVVSQTTVHFQSSLPSTFGINSYLSSFDRFSLFLIEWNIELIHDPLFLSLILKNIFLLIPSHVLE